MTLTLTLTLILALTLTLILALTLTLTLTLTRDEFYSNNQHVTYNEGQLQVCRRLQKADCLSGCEQV